MGEGDSHGLGGFGGHDAGHDGHHGAYDAGGRRSSSAASSSNEEKMEQETEYQEDAQKEEQRARRPQLISRNSEAGISTRSSTDDEGTRVELVEGLPAEIPLEALAGPGLVTTTLNDEEFDWAGGEDDEEDDKEKKKEAKRSTVLVCLTKNSSYIAWTCIVTFALMLIAVDVALFVVYRDRVSMVSYNLELWFTWAAFMWCIGMILQVIVELVPWAIKRIVGVLRPQSTEVLRMRLAYYMALRTYVKLLVNSAWCWGSWALIRNLVPLPSGGSIPNYVGVLYSIWECVFFAALLVFIEKFLLQLIVTSFHKKAYGDRIKENDRTLKILDRLKKVKRKTPQDFLRKHIRRPNVKGGRPLSSGVPSRSASTDEGVATAIGGSTPQALAGNPPENGQPTTRSIMRSATDDGTGRANVRFPSTNMDTLIAIPPLDDRNDDGRELTDAEKRELALREMDDDKEQFETTTPPPRDAPRRKSDDFVTSLTRRLRDVKHKKHKGDAIDQDTRDRAADMNTNGYVHDMESPPPLSRNNTWMSFRSGEHSDKKFLTGAKDFGLNTTAIPGKLIKGGYKKLRATTQSTLPQQQQGTTRQAKALAKRIFNNLVPPGRNHIVESDLYPYFRTQEEATAAFRLFDRDGNGDVSKRELRSGCIRIYRERKNLAHSMRDLSQATGTLDLIILVIFTIIWVVIVCAAFGVNVGTSLMPLWSAFIAASFIFGNSAKEAFDAIIFVFVTHPFDAGDRVFIGAENWVVANVGLLVSTFIKWDGTIVYAKNSILSTQYIINARRSGITGETVDLNIAFTTPNWKINALRDHMHEWSHRFPALYNADSTGANIISFENQNRITMTFYFEHTQNWQDPGGRWLRHNNFMMELKEACERLEIVYTLPSQPLENHRKRDVPAELDNLGDQSSYGQNGLHMRRPYNADETRGMAGPGATPAGQGAGGDSGAEAGAAATMMFAASM